MRLIDADELRAWLVKAGRFLKLQDDKRTASHAIGKIIDHVDKTPAVDAVPVVRCRECRYYAASGATTSFCIHPGGMKFTSDSDYCSRGQRRDQFAGDGNMDEATGMENDRRRALADGLFILLSAIMLLVVFCAAWSHYDRLGWVRFVSALPFPGWVKSILWGWT